MTVERDENPLTGDLTFTIRIPLSDFARSEVTAREWALIGRLQEGGALSDGLLGLSWFVRCLDAAALAREKAEEKAWARKREELRDGIRGLHDDGP